MLIQSGGDKTTEALRENELKQHSVKAETLQTQERPKLSFKEMKLKFKRPEESSRDVSVLFRHERNRACLVSEEIFVTDIYASV